MRTTPDPSLAAMIALRDVGVVRAPLAHAGYARLVEVGFAFATRPPLLRPVRDYRLTARGEKVARTISTEIR